MATLVFSDGTGEGIAGSALEALTKARAWGERMGVMGLTVD